jgi:hypothetical protein
MPPNFKFAKPVRLIAKNKERLLSISEACDLFRVVSGQSKSLVTVYRYSGRGLRGVKLETVLNGGRLFTSKQAIGRFLRAQSIARESRYGVPSLVAPKRKKRP